TLSGSLALILISVDAAHWQPGGQDYAYRRRINFGFGEACEYGARFTAKPECRNSDAPSIMVWGDSLAMHLVPGIAATSGPHGVAQATRSSCGPLLNVAPVSQTKRRTATGLTTQWAESCIDFNQSVVDYLARAPSVEVVVLSTLFRQYLDPLEHRVMQRLDGDYLVADAGAEVAFGGLRRTITTIRALGKRVVVVAPPPSGKFDIGRCLERRAEGKLLFGAPSSCQVQLEEYHRARRQVLEFIARARDELDVEALQFDPVLCNTTACDTQIDDMFVYRDAVHFSYDGSRLVALRMSLGSKLWTMAR
ncbi:MAG: SGNH hydrolase domain-containing protein, partial [Terriglobales bacterium]